MGTSAIIFLLFLAGVGTIAAIALVAAYTALATGLPGHEQARPTSSCPRRSIIYDRTGKVELARFGDAKREVVTFEQIPPILVDATTAIEDKTFWENAGFDPVAIISAGLDSLRGNSRGASTITQQLVRARLLTADLVQDPSRTAERKLKEIIQSIRVTQAYPARPASRQIITAYLNQNYYGNQSYGVKAASRTTSASRSSRERDAGRGGDHRRAAEVAVELRPRPQRHRPVPDRRRGRRRVPGQSSSSSPTTRSSSSAATRSWGCWPRATGRRSPRTSTGRPISRRREDDQVVLANQAEPHWVAPHFVWAVRDELTLKLCGPDAESCDDLERGGLRVTTTLDVKLQRIAEKWVEGAAIVPHRATIRRRRRRRWASRPPGVDEEPGGQEGPQRVTRRARLRDRRAGRLRGIGQVLRDQEQQAVPAAVRRRRPRAIASRARRSSRSTT